MLTQRNQLRLPAAVVTGLLLLTGIGEAAGFSVCIHHGTAHHRAALDTHSPESGTPDSSRDPRILGHAHSHGYATGGETEPGERAGSPEATESHQTRIPVVSGVHHQPSPDHDEACRVLCAAVSTTTPAPPDTRPAIELPEIGHPVVSAPLVATGVLKPTKRPHFLPPSQGPPAQA